MALKSTKQNPRRRQILELGLVPLVASLNAYAALADEVVMKIRIRTPDAVVHGHLLNNAAARRFSEMLPLSLTLDDYASTEKVADLGEKLPDDLMPAGFEPKAGDITQYAPWGNLAIFHKGFRYSDGLLKLGEIEQGLDVLRRPGKVRVTIERDPG